MTVMDRNVGVFLQDAFLNDRVAHAYIVEGEKHQLQELLKQCALVCMCKNHQGDGCEVCKKVRDNLHQDVLRFPKDADRQRLTVADMEALVEECYKRPVDDVDCRVFLIDASNSVAGIASEVWQNKLLKTLEEPTENTFIFIGVSDAEALLPTIRSRCQVLKQTRLGAQEVCDALQRKSYEKRFCEIAASVCGGSVETAESILADPSVMKAFQTAVDVAENMTSTKNALKFVSAVLAEREHVNWFLNFLTVLYRESIVYRLAEDLCLLPSHKKTVQKICQNYSLQAAEVCIEKVNSAKKRLDDGGNLTVVIDQLASAILEVRFRCRI